MSNLVQHYQTPRVDSLVYATSLRNSSMYTNQIDAAAFQMPLVTKEKNCVPTSPRPMPCIRPRGSPHPAISQLLKLVILLIRPRKRRILYCLGGFMGVRKDAVEEVDGLSAALMMCPMPVIASSTPCSPALDVSTSKYAHFHS